MVHSCMNDCNCSFCVNDHKVQCDDDVTNNKKMCTIAITNSNVMSGLSPHAIASIAFALILQKKKFRRFGWCDCCFEFIR